MTRVGLALCFAVAFAACGKHDDVNGTPVPIVRLTPAQRTELDQQIARSTQRGRELDRTWLPAINAVDPHEHASGDPCEPLRAARDGLAGNPQTYDWGSWDVGAPALGFNASSIASFSHAPFPVEFVLPGGALPAESPELRARIATVARAGAPSPETFKARLAAAKIDALTTSDVLIALDQVEQPHQLDSQTFAPGKLVARVWVFDHTRGEVVCAGIATATSSKNVDVASSNLADDLLINLMRSLPDQIFAMGGTAPGGGTLMLHGEHGDVALPFGRVRKSEHALRVVLGDDDPGCPDQPAPGRARVEFELPAGPGGRFYLGGKIGVAVLASSSAGASGLAPELLSVRISSLGHAAGAHLRGSLDLGAMGGGAFDAIVCPEVDFAALHALPAAASDKPFSGTLGGKPFVVRSAIARIERDRHLLGQLRLFAKAGVTCAIGDADAGTEVRIADIGGASVKRPLRDSPQPASAALRDGPTIVSYDTAATWIRLDRGNATFAAAQPLTGALVIDGPPDQASGTFRAVVCP